MATCAACGKGSLLIAQSLGSCGDCLRAGNRKAIETAEAKRRRARKEFDLPLEAPRDPDGVACALCVRACRIGEGKRGFCGIRANQNGSLRGGDPSGARVQYYHDPLPTNCVADWVCPEGSAQTRAAFRHAPGPAFRRTNLAVFYEACSFDCLFCQNWHYRPASKPGGRVSAADLAEAVDRHTACICYFGGDPAPQAEHALEASRIARRRFPSQTLRICWETNGSENPRVLDEIVGLSLETGGCIKFDLKAHNKHLHTALCGIDNRRTLASFRRATARIGERPDPPLVLASTLLVPGYVDAGEVAEIARFIADVDPSVPYSLLAFHPDFLMADLPRTSSRHARDAEQAARDAGLARVRVGNAHLLGDWY
jgi:pyruvate formate lyase activating enzyme